MYLKTILGITSGLVICFSSSSVSAENEKRTGESGSQVNSTEGMPGQDKRASMKWDQDTRRGEQILRDAKEAVRALKQTNNGDGVPSSVKDAAECIAIIPGVVTAAVGIGGSHGNGVAVCKTSTSQANNRDNRDSQGQNQAQVARNWSDPAFMDISGASLGAQLGFKRGDVVLYFTSKKAAEALKRGETDFGADIGVVAGNFDRGFHTSHADVVAYQNTSGAFAGASISGGSLSADRSLNEEYYGREVTVSEILSGSVTSDKNQHATQLISELS